ncbi:MAG TPA: hypothetical protein GXZ67_02520 [Clostridiaceae bacterium]|jgi:cell shape-determining protein MreD|nr:hypothetical protein [Clostridiaceae bacterium]
MTRKERIRKILVYSIYILLVPAMQVSFSMPAPFDGYTPDFMLLLVVISGYLFGTFDGAVVGLFVGLMRDYYAGPAWTFSTERPSALIGVGMLVFFYLGILASLIFAKAFHRRLSMAFVQVLLFTFIYKIIGHISVFFVGVVSTGSPAYLTFSQIVLQSILPQILLNIIAAVPIVLCLKYLGPYKSGINRMLPDVGEGKGRQWQIA